MKKVILLSFIVVIMFVACSERSDLPVQKVQSPTYTNPYPQDMLMSPAIGGVYYYIANSDLIVYGTAESIVGPVNYVTSDLSAKPRYGKLVKFKVEEILYVDKLSVDVKKDTYIDWVIICDENNGMKPDYEVFEGEKYLLFLRERLPSKGVFITFNLGYGRISDSTQKVGKHDVFSSKSVEEIKQDVILSTGKIQKLQGMVVKKYEFSMDRINNSISDDGSILTLWGGFLEWDKVPSKIKSELSESFEGIVGFCDSEPVGHLELSEQIEMDGYIYIKMDWNNDYNSKGCTIFGVNNLPKDKKAVSTILRQRFY